LLRVVNNAFLQFENNISARLDKIVKQLKYSVDEASELRTEVQNINAKVRNLAGPNGHNRYSTSARQDLENDN